MSDKKHDSLGGLDTMVAESAHLGSQPGKSLAPQPLVGGRYEIVALVGSGAMGTVYRARDVELDEIVALKFLRADLVDAPIMLERFRREVKLARRVTHTNVARVFDIGEHGKDKFLTMEFIAGEPLSALLARQRALSPERALAVIAPICAGLSAAHAVEVVHRDLKPDNVLLAPDGRVVITDFGIARSAVQSPGATIGGVVGTPAYMAPEQVEGAAGVDRRADLYALGAMLFEMLTGQLPFQRSSAIAMAAARLLEPPPDARNVRPDLPAAIAEVIKRCMARKPADRYASADEVLAALTPLMQGGATLAASAAPAPPPVGASTAVGDKTVAVLPFKNLGSPDDAYIAEGLSDDLIDTLSMVQGLRVRPRGVVARFAADADPRDVGRELDVQVIVEGSVRRRGEALRISARVLSVAEGFQLWARRFDRPEGDALVVSDEVADAVAQALTISPALQHRVAPTDPIAVDLYLRGRAELRTLYRDGLRRAVVLLREAHQRAPNDPAILATYARANGRLWFFDPGSNAEETSRLTLELAERAVAAAPERAEALIALGQVSFARTEYDQAARLAKRALARSPLLPEAHELVGRIVLEVGPLDEGTAMMERAHSLDPLDESPIMELARAYALSGEFERLKRFLLANPPQRGMSARAPVIARYGMWSGHPEEWMPMLPALDDIEPMSPQLLAVVAREVVETNRLDPQYEGILEHLQTTTERPARFRILLGQVGCEFHAYMGNHEKAIHHMENAVRAGLIDLMWVERCQLLAELRKLPGFSQLAEVVRERAQRIRRALDEG